jgi:hypothetical protein
MVLYQPSMKPIIPIAAIAVACLGAAAGWTLRDHAEGKKCSYLADGYRPFAGEYYRLPAFSDDQIPDAIVANVQQCWATHPYFGPHHSIQMVDARKVSETRYYLAFEPAGITDINLVFLVDKDNGVIDALQRSTM